MMKIVKATRPLFHCSKRFFSNKYASDLQKIIQQEITHEEKNYEPLPENEKTDFLEANNFSLEDPEHSTLSTLKKTAGEYEVTIKFFSRAPTPYGEEEEDQEEEMPQSYADFSIIINKHGESSGILVDAMSQESSISINQVHFSENIAEYYAKYLQGEQVSSYFGPEFSTLDERLQTSFMNFLESVGVNEEVASFIEVYALDKDQRLYFNWLNDMKSFI